MGVGWVRLNAMDHFNIPHEYPATMWLWGVCGSVGQCEGALEQGWHGRSCNAEAEQARSDVLAVMHRHVMKPWTQILAPPPCLTCRRAR